MTKISIRAVIFDFDGTICDSLEIKGAAFASLYKSHGSEIQQKVIEYHHQNGGVSRVDKFLYFQKEIIKEDFSIKRIEELSNEFSKLVVKKVIAAAYIDGAYSFLKRNYKKFYLYVSSGTPSDELKLIIKGKAIEKFFVSVHGSPSSKSEHINFILNKKNFKRDEIVFVGDSHSDEYAAKNTGINFIGIGPNFNFSKNSRCIKDLNSLEDTVLSVCRKSQSHKK